MANSAVASAPVSIDQEAMESLRAGVQGRIFQPGDEGYDEARAIWNGMIDKRPALIV